MPYAQFVIEQYYDGRAGVWRTRRHLVDQKDQRTDIKAAEMTYLNNLEVSGWSVVAVTVEGERSASDALGRGRHDIPLRKVYLLWGLAPKAEDPSLEQ